MKKKRGRDANATALLCLHLQTDYMPGGAFGCDQAADFPKRVNKLKETYSYRFNHIFWVQHTYPEDHISFYINHEGKEDGDIIDMPDGGFLTLRPPHCIAGTLGATVPAKLKTSVMDRVLVRGTDSIRHSESSFSDTALDTLLKKENVTTLYIVGVYMDYGIKQTAMDAAKKGYAVWIFVDLVCCMGDDEEDTKKELKDLGIQLIISDKL